MMGRAMAHLGAPVVKGMSAVLVLPESASRRMPEQSCIRCGKCVSVCPMGLEPYLLSKLSQKAVWDEAEAHRVTDCIECGSCSWKCPSALPLLDYIRLGKTDGDEDNTFPEGTVTAEAAAFSVPVTVSFRPGRRRCEVRLKRRETKSIWIRI